MAGANQTAIPILKTNDDALNQVQQNANKVFRNQETKVAALQMAVAQMQGVGDVILSALTLAQFQAVHGKNWIMANGQSSVGTAYAALTLNRTVPNISVSGATAYIKVN